MAHYFKYEFHVVDAHCYPAIDRFQALEDDVNARVAPDSGSGVPEGKITCAKILHDTTVTCSCPHGHMRMMFMVEREYNPSTP